MFKANYKATLKALFRSPVTLLAFGATVILTLSLYRAGVSSWYTSLSTVRNEIWNDVRVTCFNLFPPFAGILVSAFMLSEVQNGFGDLLVSSRKSIFSIYFSKLCAIGTVILLARIIFLVMSIVWTWGVRFAESRAHGDAVSLPLWKIIAHFAANEAVYVPLLLVGFVAMPVFISVITNIPATGSVWNIGFFLISYIFPTITITNYYLPPGNVDNYVSTFKYIDNPEYLFAVQNGLYPHMGRKMAATLPDALTVYIAWIVFSLALLIASYFILKRRYRT